MGEGIGNFNDLIPKGVGSLNPDDFVSSFDNGGMADDVNKTSGIWKYQKNMKYMRDIAE